MSATRWIVSLSFLAGLLAGTASARADETVIFKGPAPGAADLAKILWPEKNKGQAPMAATRSIRINPDLAEPSAPRADPASQTVEADPTVATDVGPGSARAADSFGFLIQFGYDSTEILPDSRPYLDSVGAMLRLPEARGKKVVIVGHTDARGSEQYNQALSERRAAAVRSYLTREFDVSPSQIEIEGEGEHDPLSDSDPYDAQNRRVEFRAG
jgi:outer membrane protein OmpA-like peptidoglycan-associated protein